ncbi:hypothetical protein [Streptomyces sp. NBC_00645]|uniref:hypothetical protein n=1 Tax=Streptomyces sp. NBC_00645 TaxID=2975795 RepID=UPI003246085C
MNQQPTTINEAGLRALLIGLADRLAAEDPDEPMTDRSRLDLARQLTEGKDPQHSALLARTVHRAPGATRSQYAQLLRADADGLDLVARYVAANQRSSEIGQQAGIRYDEDPRWRMADRDAEALWMLARKAGHSVDELCAASAAANEGK